MLKTEDFKNLEWYYKDPIMESWTYVAMGMDNLKDYDPASYAEIKKKQGLLLPEQKEMLAYVKENSARLNLDWGQVESGMADFLQKFPLALGLQVGWDDPSFIFLYLLTKITKPRVIIETGSNVGFSSSFIALAVKENDNNCKFYTIEPYLSYEWKAMSFLEHSGQRKQKINYSKVSGNCGPLAMVPADLRERIVLKTGYSRDVLPGLLRENKSVDIFYHVPITVIGNMVWECASVLPQVPPGGYVLVHDVNLNAAFQQMFGERAGVSIKENLGVFKKIDNDYTIDGQWLTPAENAALNDREYADKKTKLESSPKEIIIQLGAACALNCVFCPGKCNKAEFKFDNFYRKLEGKISRYLAQAEKIVFKSCGSFFDSEEMLRMIRWRINCIELSFPEIEKVYFTNGLDLTAQAADFLTHPRGICGREFGVKNTVNVALFASNSRIYKMLTRSDDFSLILKRLEDLLTLRKDKESLKINLSFFASTLNIEDLPEFIRLAANLGVDKVDCSYSRVYSPAQKYLSCFFKQKMTNEILEKAGNLAGQLKLAVNLPPKFGQETYPEGVCCAKGWEQLILNAAGDILACDSGAACGENLQEKSFMDSWNATYYQSLRKDLTAGGGCFKHCFIANPACVNEFRSHVCAGAGEKQNIDILWADNF